MRTALAEGAHTALRRIASGATATLLCALAVIPVPPVTVEPVAAEDEPAANFYVNRPGPIDANNTPTVVRNPKRADNLVVVNRLDRPRFGAVLHWSADSGRSWGHTALPLPAGRDRPYAPDAAFAPDGTLYVSYVNLTGPGNVPENLWVTTSRDGGETLSSPVAVAGALSFQPRLAVDGQGSIHLTWLRGSDVAPLQLVGPPSPVVAAHSSDGGRTFSPPVTVSDPDRALVGAASPVVDSSGAVVVLYQDFGNDRRDFQNLPGPPWEEPFSLIVTRSEDGGRTFGRGVVVDGDVVPTRRFLAFVPEFPSVAAGPGGELFVAWSDGRNGDEDIFLRRSSDGGRRWSPPVRVNDNPLRDRTSQYLPKAEVAPGGRVDVLFFDRRRDPANVRADAFLATSGDDGRSFRNRRVSTSSFSSRVGSSAATHLEPDFGSRLGLVSDRRRAFAAWTDTRLGSEETGRQDVAAAWVQVAPQARGAAGWWVVAALAAGTAAVLASLVSLRRRRKSTGAGTVTSDR